LEIGITEARRDDDVFWSSSLEEEHVLLEGCGCHKGLTKATKASSYSSVNFRHKILVHFSTNKGFLKAEPGLYINLGEHIHNLIGGSQE
jgi:hypothetical protein